MAADTEAVIGVVPAGADSAHVVVPIGVSAPAGPAGTTTAATPTRPAAAIATAAPTEAMRVDKERAALIDVSPDVSCRCDPSGHPSRTDMRLARPVP